MTFLIANLLFWYFGHAWLALSKMIVSTYGKLSYLPAWKKSTSFQTSFLRYCKDIANLSGYCVWLLWLFWPANPIKKNSINLLMFKSMQKSIHHSLLSCDIAKILHICYFEYFMRAWPHASIMIVSTYMFNIFDAFLLAINQLHSILPSWDNAKDVAKLLFRVLWPYLAMSTKSDSISL